MNFEVVTKVEQDVNPVIAARIGTEFLEWLDAQGWFLGWKPSAPRSEPRSEDGGELDYEELARQWVEERDGPPDPHGY